MSETSKKRREEDSQVGMFDEGGAGDGKGAQYHCDYCRKDITNVVRVKCAECKDFDLCLECFSVGVEVFPHRNFHSYRVMDHVTTPIFEEGWGADEELLLLEAIEMFGFGNWSEVGDHVGKTKEECEAHYHSVYLTSATAPLPDLTAPVRPAMTAQVPMEDDTRLIKTKTKPKSKAPGKNISIAEQVGYAEKREEFEMEYENDAEAVLAEMEFREDDTPREKELKLKVIEIYNSKLNARLERKKFIAERGLLYKKDLKRSKEEEEIARPLKVFARFQKAEEHEAFIQGLANELRMRKRIELLQSYRQQGYRTLAEAEEAEKEKARKEEGKKKDVVLVRKKVEEEADKKKGKDKPETTPLLDLSGIEGADLLSETEKDLCSQLGLIPQHYMIIKEKMTHESYTRGYLQPGQARQLIKIDAAKTDKLFDFFVSVGWVNSMPDEPVKKEQQPPSPTTYPSYPFYSPNNSFPSYSYPSQAPSFPSTPYMPSSSNNVSTPSYPFTQPSQARQQLPYNSLLYNTPSAFPSSPTAYSPQPTYAPSYPYTNPVPPFKPYQNSSDPPSFAPG